MEYIRIDRYALLGVLRNRLSEVAKQIGIHHNTLSRRLANPDKLTIGDINRIARVCDVPASVFVAIQKTETVENRRTAVTESETRAAARLAKRQAERPPARRPELAQLEKEP